jgi:hypothetical protein
VKHPLQHDAVVTAQYVVIGPVNNLAALATAFANFDTAPQPPPDEAAATTARIPTTNVKIWSRADGRPFVEVIGPSGRTELHFNPDSARAS